MAIEPAPAPVPGAVFGPSALATPANGITVARLLLAPLVIPLMVGRDDPASWLALGLWFILCASDAADGWVARRQGVTRSGAFLDPLADKVLVLGALGALAAARRFPWLPVALIASREVAISVFRSYWGRAGRAVPATLGAKAKTVTQEVAVAAALLPWGAEAEWLADGLLWVAVALTLATGAQYLNAGSRATRTTGAA